MMKGWISKILWITLLVSAAYAVHQCGHPSMSSEYNAKYSAAKCMDGKLDTYCYNKKGGEDNPFYEVEFTAAIRIHQVSLITVNKKYASHAKNIVVTVKNDKSSSGTQLGSTFEGPATKGKETITFKSETGIMGKYVVVNQGKGIITFAEVQVNPAVHGGWTPWTKCSKTCKDNALQTRTCTNPEPQHGGNECSPPSFQKCNQDITCENCPLGWISVVSGCYKFVDSITYNHGATNCKNAGGFLVEINNQEEQDVVRQIYKESGLSLDSFWLGATDQAKEGTWLYNHSGEKVMFTAWSSGEPNGGTGENCAQAIVVWNFNWNDAGCESPYGRSMSLCEYDKRDPVNCSFDGESYDLSNTDGIIINSTNYPGNYTDNSTSEWIFIAPHGEKVSWTTLDIDTEFGYDVIRFFDGTDCIQGDKNKAPILATMSGTHPREAIISSREKMRVTFTSDININRKGFKAIIKTLKRKELPIIEWNDPLSISMTFPNERRETILLSLISNENKACIFDGKNNNNVSVMIRSSSTFGKCQSLSQYTEITVIRKQNKSKQTMVKTIYTLNNGQLKQIDEINYTNNNIIKKRSLPDIKLPKRIQITLQFACDEGLWKKFKDYGQGRSYIEKRIEELFHHSKWSLRELLNDANIELLLAKHIIFINEVLGVTNTQLLNCRKYQLDEKIPIIIIVADDPKNNQKGISFRSGACRKDKERYGVALVAWRDDGGLAGEVLTHEMGHLIGGIHSEVNGTSSHDHEHGGETEVLYTDFNSEKVKFWYNSAGYRCYGKNCSIPHDSPPHGTWVCDEDIFSCEMKCDKGFSTLISTIQCENGDWSESINEVVCSPSVFLLTGVQPVRQDPEIYHPSLGAPNCTKPFPSWRMGEPAFSYRNTIYLCGENICMSTDTKETSDRWRTFTIDTSGGVFTSNERLFFFGQNPRMTKLPLTEQSEFEFTPIPNLLYRGDNHCIAKMDTNTFVILPSKKDVIKYNVVKETSTYFAQFGQDRSLHGCAVMEDGDNHWIIVTGGQINPWHYGHYHKVIQSVEILDTVNNKWETIGDLTIPRAGHGMIVMESKVMVLGGRMGDHFADGFLKSVELLDWNLKTWKLVDPSLTKERYVNSALEIPASAFHCQLNIKQECSAPPEKQNGNWSCDVGISSCFLRCDPGFVAPHSTTTTCTGGTWTNINKIECSPSVFLIVINEKVEIYHPQIGQLNCLNLPPRSSNSFTMHTTFFYGNTIYLFGGYHTSTQSNSFNSKESHWNTLALPEKRSYGMTALVMQDTLFLIGGPNGADSISTSLPLKSNQEWSPIPNLSYRDEFSCVIKLDDTSFIITGGKAGNNADGVLKYNVVYQNTTILSSLSHVRHQHGCAMLEEDGKQWIVIAGGLGERNADINAYSGNLDTSQKLDVSEDGNEWIKLKDLKVARSGFDMINTARGIMALGGQTNNGATKTVELLEWATSKWKLVDPSLADPIKWYGGAVEIPASLFGCQTLPKTVPGCEGDYAYNVEYTGGVEVTLAVNETCHLLCKTFENCTTWTWTHEKKCFIQITNSSPMISQDGSVSGTKNSCKPKCYLVLSEHEDANTNTQYCLNEDTDCVDIIHMEPDEFQEEDVIYICHEIKENSVCEKIWYENATLFCNPEPGIVTLSTWEKINKFRFYGHLRPYFGYFG